MNKFCREDMSFEEFIELHDRFVRDNGMKDLLYTESNSRQAEKRLVESRSVLWKQNKRLR